MKHKTTLLALLAITLATGCSREQVQSATISAGQSYQDANKNDIIKKWQAKVAEKPECGSFKERFALVGAAYDGAANGKFQMDVLKIWEDVKIANCNLAP